MFKKLIKEIEYAKTCLMAREELYRVYGRCQMALELKAITESEFMALNTEAVAEGINNPKYF